MMKKTILQMYHNVVDILSEKKDLCKGGLGP